MREAWVSKWASVRMAGRGVSRDLATSATAGLILALGLAAPTAYFSVLWAGIRPLPLPDGHRIHAVEAVGLRAGDPRPVTWSDLSDLADAAGIELAGYAEQPVTLATPVRGNVRLAGAVLTPNALSVLRVTPLVGRVPDGRDPLEILISHAVWTSAFAAEPAAVGAEVRINGELGTVAGVLPEGFGFPFRHDAWVISSRADEAEVLALFARLPRRLSPGEVAPRLSARWPQAVGPSSPPGDPVRVSVTPFTRGRGDPAETWVFAGLVLVGLALLGVAIVNASLLFLVRAVERSRALAVQSALGAARSNIATQLLVEALLVASGGGLLGVGLAGGLLAYVQRQASTTFGYWWMEVSLEGPALAFTGALVLGSALMAGLAPLRRALRPATGTSGRSVETMERPAVSIAYLSLSCAALAVAVMASDAVLSSERYGENLRADRIAVAQVDPTLAGAADRARAAIIRDEVMLAMTRIGVGGGTSALSVGAPGYREPFARQERAGAGDGPEWTVVNAVTTDFHALYPAGVVRGALPTGSTEPGEGVQAVVNTAWVDRFSPGADPVGSWLTLPDFAPGVTLRVTGVVETVRLGGGSAFREDRVYLPLQALPAGPFTIQVLAPGEGETVLQRVRRAIEAVDPDLALERPMTLSEAHHAVARSQRTLAALAAWGGFSTLVVGMLGLHALLAFRVRRRRREWGVRMALGADGAQLVRELATFALARALPGAAGGLLLAWLATPAVKAILLGNVTGTVAALTGVGAAFLLTSLLAVLRPALDLSRTRPASVLQAD